MNNFKLKLCETTKYAIPSTYYDRILTLLKEKTQNLNSKDFICCKSNPENYYILTHYKNPEKTNYYSPFVIQADFTNEKVYVLSHSLHFLVLNNTHNYDTFFNSFKRKIYEPIIDEFGFKSILTIPIISNSGLLDSVYLYGELSS